VRFPVTFLVLLVATMAAAGCADGQPVPSTPDSSPTAVIQFSPSASVSPNVSGNSSPAPAGSQPNRALTPGEVFAGVTAQEVCVSGYAGRVRNVQSAQYVQVYASYGIPYPEPAGSYELDHLVPLELGGANSNRNLWPEPAQPVPGFHQKDLLENYLHAAVCGGRMALADAQAGIASDWIALYRLYIQP
jgi:hypothetical protein